MTASPPILNIDLPGYAIRHPQRSARTLINRIAFSLHQSEVLAIYGPSGCGKTTLMRIIGGLTASDPGVVTWPMGPRRISFVFQEPCLLPWRSVRDNIRLVLNKGENAGVVDELLASLGLGGWAETFPNRLSLGMARRVAVARALAARPDVLLLDEPLASLDPEAALSLTRLLSETCRARNITAVIVSHELRDVVALADRMIVLGSAPTEIRAVIAITPEIRALGPDEAIRQVSSQMAKGNADS